MSLQRLHLSLQRLIPRRNADNALLADLESLFLTSRQCSERYHHLVPELLNIGNPDIPSDPEQAMMWFAFKNDKPPDESTLGENEEEKEEKWKKDWLDRMERRESVCLPRFYCALLSTLKGTGSSPLASVPVMPSHSISHRSARRGHVCLP